MQGGRIYVSDIDAAHTQYMIVYRNFTSIQLLV